MSERASRPPRRTSKTTSLFLRGLATLLPAVLTIFVFVTLVNFVKTYVVGPINDVIYWGLEGNALGWKVLRDLDVEPYDPKFVQIDALPAELRFKGENEGFRSPDFLAAVRHYREARESFFRDLDALAIQRGTKEGQEGLRDAVEDRVHPLVGLGMSVLLVLWIGWLVGGFLGRRAFARVESGLAAIPGVRSVYPYSKRFVEFFFSDRDLELDTVVAIPYPSEHLWSLAFVTSRSMRSLRAHTGDDLVTVFVPSSPMPMTGYTIHVAASRLVPLPISVDDALRVTVSGGVLIPSSEYAGDVPASLRAAASARAAQSSDEERLPLRAPDRPEREAS